MELNTLQDLFVDTLKDMYDAEKQIIYALPKIADAATSRRFKAALEIHVRQTGEHIERLEQVFDGMNIKAARKTCKGMKSLLQESSELISENVEPQVLDAGLIAIVQKVEHYEISSYGTLSSYANLLGESNAAKLFQQSLDEERQIDQDLTELAENTVNVRVA